MSDITFITPTELKRFATALLEKGGFTAEESAQTAKSLVLSNLMGHDSHGVMRIDQYLNELSDQHLASGVTLDIDHETPNSCAANANLGLGQVQMPRLIEKLLDKTKNSGVVTGSLRNSGHVGRAGEWVDVLAAKGYAAFITVNDNGKYRVVAPPSGIEGRTSTNPLAFALPLPDGELFSIDLSTSASAAGKIRVTQLAGRTVPEGVLQDAEGRITTDPNALFEKPRGSLLPAGGEDQGYKGFALSMIVDCLTSGLSGGAVPPAPKETPYANNVLMTIWNPAHFAGLEYMQGQTATYLGSGPIKFKIP